MTRIINKRGLSKDTTKRKGKTSGSSHASHQLCKRCSRRFGSKACAKRLCGSCCPVYAGSGRGAQCVAHLSLRKAAKRRRGAYLLVASVNRLQRAESKERKRSKKQKHLAKRIKTLTTTTQECSDDDQEESEEMEVVPQDEHADDGDSVLEALVAVQAEEIARLRRELKLTRHAHDRLKRKQVKVEQGLCIICEERSLNVLLVPCGHCYCRECVAPLRSCPVCRTAIRKQHSYHPPAYVCDSAVLESFSAKPVVPASEEDDGDDSSSSSSLAPPSPDFVMRRRSAANPHRVLFV